MILLFIFGHPLEPFPEADPALEVSSQSRMHLLGTGDMYQAIITEKSKLYSLRLHRLAGSSYLVYRTTQPITSVAVSQDGRTLAITRKNPGNRSMDVYLIQLNANKTSVSSISRITNTAYNEFDVSISADGTQLVWSSPKSKKVKRTVYHHRNMQTGKTKHYTHRSRYLIKASISAGGHYVVYGMERKPQSKVSFYSRNLTGSANNTYHTFGYAPITSLSISDDKKTIAWSSSYSNKTRLYWHDKPSKVKREIRNRNNNNALFQGLTRSQISRDGRYILHNHTLQSSEYTSLRNATGESVNYEVPSQTFRSWNGRVVGLGMAQQLPYGLFEFLVPLPWTQLNDQEQGYTGTSYYYHDTKRYYLAASNRKTNFIYQERSDNFRLQGCLSRGCPKIKRRIT